MAAIFSHRATLHKVCAVLPQERTGVSMSELIATLEQQRDLPNDLLCSLLEKHYGQKPILLIDEYDVPLDKAYYHGYYPQMIDLIRAMFQAALKTNSSLFFAVLTGCLRVSKESIFTGLNNFDVNSIIDVEHDEQFGFTEAEVQELLQYYDREAAAPVMKAWYDGYRFGNAEVYCPWDVINYAKKLLANPQAEPQAFWINSSGNDLVKRFVDKADKTTQDEIERLIAGEAIEKAVRLELTYGEIDNSIISSDVRIRKGAQLSGCVIMRGTEIGEGVIMKNVIADKSSTVSSFQTIMGSEKLPVVLPKGTKI